MNIENFVNQPAPERKTLRSKALRVVGEFGDAWLKRRAEWMVDAVKAQKYLAHLIDWKDPQRKIFGAKNGVDLVCVGAGKGHEMDELDQVLPGSTIKGLDPDDYMSRPVKNRLKNLAHDSTYLSEHNRAEHMKDIPDASVDDGTFFSCFIIFQKSDMLIL